MKYFLLVIGILVIIDISYFAYVNQGNVLVINYKPIIGDFEVESGLLYFGLGISSFIGGVLMAFSKVVSLKTGLKKLSRKTEKSAIESEESHDRVKQLQAKVDTLEAALKEALNKNN